MEIARLIAPFLDKESVHLPGGPDSRIPLSRARLMELLDHPAHWTDRTLKLAYNATGIPREEYCLPDGAVFRPHIPRVRDMLDHGISMVCDNIGAIAPEVRAIGDALTSVLGGRSWANVYLSFQGIQAFGPHYDLTDVLALHCEGEKTWRLYASRAENSAAFPPGDDAAVRAHFRAAAGNVEREVLMRPGDTLYIPAGFYHDALAQSPHALHVTFALQRPSW